VATSGACGDAAARFSKLDGGGASVGTSASASSARPDPWGKPMPGRATDDDHDKDDDDDAPAGLGLGTLLGGGGGLAQTLLTVLARLGEPGPYEAPKAGPGAAPGAPAVGVLDLSGAITELATYSMTGGDGGTPLREVTGRLRALAADPQLTGLIIRVGGLEVSQPDAAELRLAMGAFQAAGKPLHCHAESPSGMAYLVMTACDSVGLAPLGTVMLAGPTAMPVHLKPAMDRLGVTADFLHVGAFKGAAEPLTRDAPSPEMLETMNAILDQRYASMLGMLETSRRLSRAEAAAIIDEGMLPAPRALATKAVDVVEPFEAFRQRLAGDAWREVGLEADPAADPQAAMMKLMSAVGLAPPVTAHEPHVALFYAVGDVVDGAGDGVLGAREQIASHTVIAALRRLAADDMVKAVVLRIDSGGGSALASELIWHELAALKAKKPVIVSMSDVAASGGYYIAAPADMIFAMPDTLTGSIGVVGGKLAPGGALDQLGVKTYPMGRGKRATMFSSLGPWSSDERAAMQAMMQETYDVFVSRVAAGRGKTAADIQPIAQGRVWVGTEAKRLGLVDALGGLDDALAEAGRRGGVAADAPLEVYPPSPTLRDLALKVGAVATGPSTMAGAADGPLAALAHDAIATVSPELATRATALWQRLVSFERAPVQTLVLLPELR
jgi:protease-4